MTFKAGERVRTRRQRSAGHTRLPAYLQCKSGQIVRELGTFPLADERAESRQNAKPSALYTVEFQARDVWSDTSASTIHADLFEEYLEPAE